MEQRHHQPTFNELLIREVQAHPQLYDQQHRVCTDNGERTAIWEEIAGRIDETVTGEFAKKRWLQMRDRYRKELKMALRSSIQPKWPFFQKLAWLDPYLKDAKAMKCSSDSRSDSSSFIECFAKTNPAFDPFKLGGHSGPDFLDFSTYPSMGGATNSLLESIMAAATSSLFGKARQEHQQPLSNAATDEFSPSAESATASTSEDGDGGTAGATTVAGDQFPCLGGEAGDDEAIDPDGPVPVIRVKDERCDEEEEMRDCGERKRRATSVEDHSTTVDNDITMDHNGTAELPESQSTNGTTPASSLGKLLANAENALTLARDQNSAAATFSTATTTQHQPSTGRVRNRNPPYLVRRGGGIKVRGATVRTLSASAALSPPPRPLEKSFSNGPNACAGLDHPGNLSPGTPPAPDELGPTELWTANDEDILFARLIVCRLRKFGAKDRRMIRTQINQWIDAKEEELESSGRLTAGKMPSKVGIL